MAHDTVHTDAIDLTPDAIAARSSTDENAVIRLRNLHKRFGRQRVLRGITINFPRGGTTVILGPSGCGKSVMLKHIIGLLRPDRGEVYYEDQRIDTLAERDLVNVRREIGFLFQMGALFDSLTVRDNLLFPLREHTHLDADKREERVHHMLRLVGLDDVIDKMPADLSGGQQKRIALARAIMLNPKVILYDEPTTGLDPIRADVINELIIKLQHELDATSIVVTHDLTSAFRVADYMVMLHEGKVLMEGTPEQFRAADEPTVHRFLLGEAAPEDLEAIRGE